MPNRGHFESLISVIQVLACNLQTGYMNTSAARARSSAQAIAYPHIVVFMLLQTAIAAARELGTLAILAFYGSAAAVLPATRGQA